MLPGIVILKQVGINNVEQTSAYTNHRKRIGIKTKAGNTLP